MKKEKESWTLLWVWTAYLPVKEIKWEFYVKVSDFTRCINELEQEKENLSELNRKQSKAFKETMKDYRELLRDYMKIGEENKNLNIKVASLEWEIKWLNSVIEKLREELSAYDREYFDEDKKAKNIFIDKNWKVVSGWEFRELC